MLDGLSSDMVVKAVGVVRKRPSENINKVHTCTSMCMYLCLCTYICMHLVLLVCMKFHNVLYMFIVYVHM